MNGCNHGRMGVHNAFKGLVYGVARDCERWATTMPRDEKLIFCRQFGHVAEMDLFLHGVKSGFETVVMRANEEGMSHTKTSASLYSYAYMHACMQDVDT